jgi:probable rRNA maturation factor
MINIENICPGIKVKKTLIKEFTRRVLVNEGIAKAEINIILVNDEYITRLNQKFLNKDTTTDVLSFSLANETNDQIEGEVYTNIEQIMRQAEDYQVTFKEELNRIIIHGLLHLIGFDDLTDEQKKIMTQKEDRYLTILPTKI